MIWLLVGVGVCGVLCAAYVIFSEPGPDRVSEQWLSEHTQGDR
jgi:hypothetical protein